MSKLPTIQEPASHNYTFPSDLSSDLPQNIPSDLPSNLPLDTSLDLPQNILPDNLIATPLPIKIALDAEAAARDSAIKALEVKPCVVDLAMRLLKTTEEVKKLKKAIKDATPKKVVVAKDLAVVEDIDMMNDKLRIDGKLYYYKLINIKAYTKSDGTAIKASTRRIKVKIDKALLGDIDELAGAFAKALVVAKPNHGSLVGEKKTRICGIEKKLRSVK